MLLHYDPPGLLQVEVHPGVDDLQGLLSRQPGHPEVLQGGLVLQGLHGQQQGARCQHQQPHAVLQVQVQVQVQVQLQGAGCRCRVQVQVRTMARGRCAWGLEVKAPSTGSSPRRRSVSRRRPPHTLNLRMFILSNVVYCFFI